MPIRFRCTYCNRLLGIATRKAGMETTCPHCGYDITVPDPSEEPPKTERLNLEDIDDLLGESGSGTAKAVAAPPALAEKSEPQVVAKPAESPAAKPRHTPAPAPKRASPSTTSGERPLFEAEIEELLGETAAPEEPERAKPRATSGMDAMSLSEPSRHIVLGPTKATLLFVVVVALMALSFAAGYFLAPKG